MAMAKAIEAAAMFALMTCIGCAPGPRRLSRSRSHLSPQCRRILLTTTTIAMIILELNHRAMEGPVLLVAVQGGRPTLLHLCSDPARRDDAATASTLGLPALNSACGDIFWNNERYK